MEEILLKSEKTTQSFLKTFHLYQDGNSYFLRRELYKSKSQKQHILSDEFEIELINLKIQIPSPFDTILYRYYCWMPALNFTFSSGSWHFYGIPPTTEVAVNFVCNGKAYELDNDNADEYVKNYIRNLRLKSILD